jgi:hypothetical protein
MNYVQSAGVERVMRDGRTVWDVIAEARSRFRLWAISWFGYRGGLISGAGYEHRSSVVGDPLGRREGR